MLDDKQAVFHSNGKRHVWNGKRHVWNGKVKYGNRIKNILLGRTEMLTFDSLKPSETGKF